MAAVGCPVNFGASGAPVLAGTTQALVAVVSAIGRLGDGGEVALAVAVAPRLEELRAPLARAAPETPRLNVAPLLPALETPRGAIVLYL